MNLARGTLTLLVVVHALVLRETRTRFGAHQLGYLWAFVEPSAWILTFLLFFFLLGRQAPTGMDLFGFLATGLLPFDMAMKSLDKTSHAVDANRALLSYRQVKPLDLILARAVLEGATYVSVFAVLMLGRGLLVQDLTVDDPLTVLLGFVLAGLLGSSVGLVLCALATYSTTVHRLQGPVLRPLFWVSCIFYSPQELPTEVRDLFLYNPLVHVIELVRDGWFRGYSAPEVDVGYVALWTVVAAAVGLTVERSARVRVQVT